MSNDYLYINAIRFKKVERTPIWIMRQAGRYLPEYHQVRDKHDFLTVCKTPDLAAELTLQPIRRFHFDAAILFSDILVIPEALGQKLEFLENHGPLLSPQILTEDDLTRLDAEELLFKLNYVAEAVRCINQQLPADVPLIGFSGSPLTLATYMIEGKPTRNFKYIKSMLYTNPSLLKKILEMLRAAVSGYLKMQINAGVNAVQIFDTWGAILPPHQYDEFSGSYMKAIVNDLKPTGVPVTLFSKGGIDLLKILADSEADILGVDWMTSMNEARSIVNGRKALQGNMDPTVLYGSRETIRREVSRLLNVFKGESGHVFNLGHGILPDIPVDNVRYLVDQVRSQSSKLHAA